jgi:hypothetical protein
MNYKVEDIEHIYLNRKRRTRFNVFEETQDAYVFIGNMTMAGWITESQILELLDML